MASCWVSVSGIIHRLRQGEKNLQRRNMAGYRAPYILAGYLSFACDGAQIVLEYHINCLLHTLKQLRSVP